MESKVPHLFPKGAEKREVFLEETGDILISLKVQSEDAVTLKFGKLVGIEKIWHISYILLGTIYMRRKMRGKTES